ncbi:pre-mRNA splicing factor cwc15 [Sordaria brevicollis]|uniref:Pre-mRNA splicing factor cwc15 n=1 Tax=Sordaria brevicollis TaxID=83679 RepID=A0AAE0P1W7_SORBR|nr:pre-mRNA splicing factor cwc15 [Sordaria brevicollis]
MTTAHRPTFDPAKGKEALRGPAYHQRLLPAYTQLKFRKPGQGGVAGASEDRDTRDLRAELLAAEEAHKAKLRGGPALTSGDDDNNASSAGTKRPLALTGGDNNGREGEEDQEAKRRRILDLTREIDADDSSDDDDSASESGSPKAQNDDDDDDDSDSDSDSDSDDEEAELQRELERVRRERQEKREREEAERLKAEEEQREKDIALGNPLLNKPDFTVKRRWDDDVVFKNQARGVDDRNKKKEFVNDLLRSDFHRRFMSKYVR